MKSKLRKQNDVGLEKLKQNIRTPITKITKINRRNGLTCRHVDMETWRHGYMIERLKYYGTKLGIKVLIIGEEYTSKTCNNCGTLENKLGNKDILKFKSCGICIDRDTNGS